VPVAGLLLNAAELQLNFLIAGDAAPGTAAQGKVLDATCRSYSTRFPLWDRILK